MRALSLLLLAVYPVAARSGDGPAFVDHSEPSGLVFHHFNGMSGKLYFAEHMGSGVALFDYDKDGDLDVFLGQGNMLGEGDPYSTPIPPRYPLPLTDRLYRNDLTIHEDGSRVLRFVDVTEESDLRSMGYNMGVAVADYDNDGFDDLYITNLGANQLWHNDGDGTFSDRTDEASVGDPRWSVAASFVDYDRDGWLDLYVGNYVEFRVATHKECASSTGGFGYCGPKAYPAEHNRLYRNRGDGTFEDVTSSMGMEGTPNATLGTIVADFDDDGWPDLFVANDQMVNELWLNQKGQGFVDDAQLSGTAVDALGQAQASMGVVAGDLNGDGLFDLFMTHLVRETNTLYLNAGDGMFEDATRKSGLGEASFSFTGFGTSLLDYDLDGELDLYVANGAVKRIEEQLREGVPLPLAQTNLLFRGLGSARWQEVPAEERESPVLSEVSRALATGDLDNDGDADLVLTNNAGPARLLVNSSQPGDAWCGLRLVSKTAQGSERDALGAQVALDWPGQKPTWRRINTDGSYASANDPRVIFALPKGETPSGIRVRWPDGRSETFPAPEQGRYQTLRQGTGGTVPLRNDQR